MDTRAKLAIDGGDKAVSEYPKRRLFGKEERDAVVRFLDENIAAGNTPGYNGPAEQAYCDAFAEYLGGGYVDAVNSGTSAVYVAIRALEIPAFSEVLCGPISDPGGIMPIALAGCIPIIVDGAPGTFNMSPESLEERITERTRAIIVTHIAGIPADMDRIMAIAKAHNLPVIEDCAQAHGATHNGRMVGTIGDVGAFSMMFGKHHCTGGQGGAVFTKDEETYWKIRRCSDRGKRLNLPAGEGNVVAAFNMNLHDLGGVIGQEQLKKLPNIVARRRETAEVLASGLKSECKGLRILEGLPGTEPSFWFLIAHMDLDKFTCTKEKLCEALAAEGVSCVPNYGFIFSDHEWYTERKVFDGTDYPWGSPLYKGDPKAEYPVPESRKTAEYAFPVFWNEGVTVELAKEIVAAFKKVEAAYLK